jgi:formylglycine-generating enzyme
MKRFLFVAFMLLATAVAYAQTRGFVEIRQQSKDHIALVIGNSNYPDAMLENPKNDASDVAQTFTDMGFIVEKVLDADKEQMGEAIKRFSAKMPTAKAAVFYYAGHGMQVDGENYLIPISRTTADQISDETQVKYRAFNAGEILQAMDKNHVKFAMVVLDACRNNPIKGTGRGKLKGLASIDAPLGSLIMYATKAGDVAADGSGRNSPFTTAFLQHIKTPGLDVNLLPSKITATVNELTQGRQTPGTYMQLSQSFTFVPELTDEDLVKLKAEKERLAAELKNKQYTSEQERLKQKAEYERLMAEINKVENYDVELAQIERKKAELAALDQQIANMKKQNAEGVDNLDAMLVIIANRKKRNDELEAMKQKAEAERLQKQKDLAEKQKLAEAERLRKAAEITELKWKDYDANMAKYDKIAGSEFGQDLKENAWTTVLRNLGLTTSIPTGDKAAVLEATGLVKKVEAEYTVNVAGLSISLRGITGGSFSMGSNNGGVAEKPEHTVYLGSFAMMKYEVTFDEYDKFCDATQRSKPSDQGWGRGNRPVINVSWDDANAYAQWLSTQTGQTWRLPTEAEWEYAARGGNKSRGYQYAGSNDVGSVAQYAGNNNKSTESVGSKHPNELGIYDMSGNVWEWCIDLYDDNYYANSPSNNPSNNPQGPSSGSNRVYRGGSWISGAGYCRVARCDNYMPSGRGGDLGFRLVLAY